MIQFALIIMNFLARRTMKGEKPTAKTSLMSYVSVGGVLRTTMRLFQFVMGIVVIGLYAQDLRTAKQNGKYADPKWVFAVFCGSISSLCAVIFMVPLVLSHLFFYIDAAIFLFWVVLFGIFGKMYLTENPEGNAGIIRMKHAAWIDMTNMLLWFITAAYGAFVFWGWRKECTTTNRADNHV